MSPASLVAMTLLSLVVLSACEVEPRRVTSQTVLVRSSTHYADPEEQRRLKNALKAASIPHEVSLGSDGKEYISWEGAHDAAVDKMKDQLFGAPLPDGRHIHFGGEFGERFKAWLTANQIPFQTTERRGKEFVIWKAEDSPRVAKWEYFPSHYWQTAKPLSATNGNR